MIEKIIHTAKQTVKASVLMPSALVCWPGVTPCRSCMFPHLLLPGLLHVRAIDAQSARN